MKIIWSPAVTLDGYIAEAGGNADWVSDQDEALFRDLVKQSGCVIVGHTTYRQYKNEIYPVPGAMTFVLATHPEREEPRNGVAFIHGTPQEIIVQLESRGFRQAVLAGGGQTNSAFVTAGLVDEVVATMYPLIFGKGVKLVGGISRQLDLRLVDVLRLKNDVVRHRYLVVT